MKESDLKKVFSKNENIVFHEEKDFGLLFDMDTGRTRKIDTKAVMVWKLLDGKTAVESIIAILKTEYGASDTLSENVWKFLSNLQKMGCIKEIL
jgi:hypothetical protein